MRVFPLFVLIAVFVSIYPLPAAAQAAAAAQVEVASVKFGAARFGGDSWLEADVELDVKPGGKPVSGEFVNRVRVTLTMGCDAVDLKGVKRLDFYRSSAELISVEGGKTNVRFYLPPEIVKRDKLKTPIDYFAVELEAAGEAQAAVKESASPKFTSAESTKNFLGKATSEAGVNDGMLMPQYLTPFSFDAQRRSPTFLRRELQR
jgi:hypothetical protein